MKGYSQLTLPPRYEVSALDKAGHGPIAIAAVVGVHRTTISRELKRNHSRTGYHLQAADRRAQQRRKDRYRPLKWTARCRQRVGSKLSYQWNPKRIANWLGRSEEISIPTSAFLAQGGTLYRHIRQRLRPKRVTAQMVLLKAQSQIAFRLTSVRSS